MPTRPRTRRRSVAAAVLAGLLGPAWAATAGPDTSAARPTAGDPSDLPVAPFGPDSYGAWTATGTAFRRGPAHDAMLPQQDIENAADNAVISSEVEGDGPTGTLTSPAFRINRQFIAFRIGGGNIEHDTCLNLLVDGRVARTAVGWRSDYLTPASWDVAEFVGRTAQVQAVDTAGGDWGHINVDRVIQTDLPERPPIEVGPLYHEALRPQFHFTARQWGMRRLNPGPREEGWVNDLNGLIFYDGEYHLFAQRWAKCWLHAVSRDLVHWTELPPAFWEESEGTSCQSGTCVIDYDNTSGLATDPKHPAMVAFWPRGNNREQCLSYSVDHGRTWRPYAKNPFLSAPERDPKVFWYAPGKHWVMMLYGGKQYHILTSANLLDWTDQHHPIPKCYECPDFFELPVDGHADQKKWVLVRGSGDYSVGTFDGTAFAFDGASHKCDPGDFYATQTWANTDSPGGDSRRIQVAWIRGAFPDMPFSQQVTFPCELSLHTTPDGLRLFRRPIAELSLLHAAPDVWADRTLRAGQTLPLELAGREFHVKFGVSIADDGKLTLSVRGVPVVLTAKSVKIGPTTVSAVNPVRSVELLVDRGSIEAFLNDGEASLTRFALPKADGLSLKAEGGPVDLRSLVVYPVRSAWADPATTP